MVGGPWRRIFAGFDDSKGNPSVIEWHRYCNGQWSMMTVKVMMTITMALAITMTVMTIAITITARVTMTMTSTSPSLLLETMRVKFWEEPTAWREFPLVQV